MNGERVCIEVAEAVRLAEGPPGVRAVVRAIARGAGSTRAAGRATSLPLPLVAAVCGELRARGVLTAERPARLTPEGQAAFGEGGVSVTGRCPACAGRGLVLPDEAALVEALAAAAADAPPVRVELDQTHCTVETKVRRVLAMHDAGALAGRRVLVLGDDDLVSLALAAFSARYGPAAGPASLTVVEIDPVLVAYLRGRLAGAPFPVDVVAHDLRTPLPDRLLAAMDTVQTDPPYTVAGAELCLARAVSALRPGAGADVFLCLGVRRPTETVRLQEAMSRLGLAVRSLVPGFNEYVGAGVLGGTSALWHLVSAGSAAVTGDAAAGRVPATRPVAASRRATAARAARSPGGGDTAGGPRGRGDAAAVGRARAAGTPGGDTAGRLYSREGGASRRRYVCAGCRSAHLVGEGLRWRTVAELKSSGCPSCGGHTFRPQARPQPPLRRKSQSEQRGNRRGG
ncbi:MAG TPA: bis-aminopropyl spermidine synthase family protein [Mycobacteriales bacterium]|nr:bis-aminopropyl spermidine synthase family protein [Mycobacteriales bacterium]